FTLDKFQKCAAARRDIGNLFLKTKLRDRRDGVSAAGDGISLRVRDRLGDGAGAVREPVLLEQTHRTVPDDRSSLGDLIGIGARGRAGLASARPSASSSAAISGPAQATSANRATACVVASARCAAPKASFT